MNFYNNCFYVHTYSKGSPSPSPSTHLCALGKTPSPLYAYILYGCLLPYNCSNNSFLHIRRVKQYLCQDGYIYVSTYFGI